MGYIAVCNFTYEGKWYYTGQIVPKEMGSLPGVSLYDVEEIHYIEEKREDIKIDIKKKYTEKEVYAMSKKEQTGILNDFGITNIPGLEKDRVSKILKLQG